MKRKIFLKRNLLVIFSGLTAIVAPIILSSCSTSNNLSNNGNTPPNVNNNNNNGSKPPSVDNNGNGGNNNSSNSNIIDKDKNPELFLSKHLFDYDKLIAMTPLEIHQSTPLYKTSLHNLKYLLESKNIDFINDSHSKEEINEVYKWYQEIGMVGNFGENDIEKVKNTPSSFSKENVLQQKLLNSFNETNVSFQVINVKSNEWNNIIDKNPFGYLPSNLNQFLYYLNISDIERISKVSNIKDVYANHNDKDGKIDIFLKDKNDSIHKISLDKTNSNLKKDDDFLQYIFDRSFFISSKFWRFDRRNVFDRYNFSLIERYYGGTMWIIDRINNDSKSDTYEFLVGTNLHVLDFSQFFEKSSSFNLNTVANKYWDGGFRDWGAAGSTTPSLDEKKKLTPKDDNIIQRMGSVEVFTKKTEDTKPIYMRMATNSVKDVSKIDPDSSELSNDQEFNIEWGSNKYMDLIWYTPNFNSSGVKSIYYDDNIFDYKVGDNRIGWVNDGGADFAVAKIKMTKNQINKLLPKLGEVIGTEQEKDWYLGLGKQEHVIANQTMFIGGYPEGYWNWSKSIGGRVTSKNRHVSSSNTVPYWIKYNKEINDSRNKKFGWHDSNEINHQPYYKGSNNRTFEHGMKMSQLIQNSILNTSANRYLVGGASGSMMIDSKFNLTGFLFNGITDDANSDFYTNSIGLMDSFENYDNWDGSIRNDILKKIKSENLHTIKINPKTK